MSWYDTVIQQGIVYKIAVFAFDCVRGTCPPYYRGVCTPLTEVSGGVGLRWAHRGDLHVPTANCQQPQGQNLANVVFALVHRESGTPCHFISVLLPSAENSSGLGSKPTSLSAPTHDSPPRTIEECNYLLTYLLQSGAKMGACLLCQYLFAVAFYRLFSCMLLFF